MNLFLFRRNGTFSNFFLHFFSCMKWKRLLLFQPQVWENVIVVFMKIKESLLRITRAMKWKVDLVDVKKWNHFRSFYLSITVPSSINVSLFFLVNYFFQSHAFFVSYLEITSLPFLFPWLSFHSLHLSVHLSARVSKPWDHIISWFW